MKSNAKKGNMATNLHILADVCVNEILSVSVKASDKKDINETISTLQCTESDVDELLLSDSKLQQETNEKANELLSSDNKLKQETKGKTDELLSSDNKLQQGTEEKTDKLLSSVNRSTKILNQDSRISTQKKNNKKQYRKRYSREESDILNYFFANNEFPSKKEREILASELNTTSRRIQVWFQNKRAKCRRKIK